MSKGHLPTAGGHKTVGGAYASYRAAYEAMDAAQDEYYEALEDYLCAEIEALGDALPEGWEWDTSGDFDLADDGPTIRLTAPGMVRWDSDDRVRPEWDSLEQRVVYYVNEGEDDFCLEVPMPPRFHSLLEALSAADKARAASTSHK